MQYRLFNPMRADMTDWIVADDMGDTGRANLGPATIILWGSDSDAEFEHFLKAVPREPSSGLLGSLGYSHAGKHHVFSVEELRKAPLTVPGTDIQIQVAEYLPNAKPGPKGKLISEGDVPVNPALVIKVTQGGKEKEYLTFGAVPEFNKILAKRQGTDHLFSYFPADLPSVVHLTVLKDGSGKGRLGYRAFGKDGLITAEEATLNKEYPSIAGFSFVPKSFLTGSHPDLLLKPQPPKRGKEGTPGVVVELQSGKEMLKTGLTRGMTNGKRFGERVVTVSYDIAETEVPFEIRLDSFEEPKNPGTRMAAMYTSKVTLFEPSGREQTAVVTMNAPLHYTDSAGNHYTLYQSGIDRPQGEDGPAVSTFTVAHDPGLNVKYAGAMIMCTGIVIMFYLGGYFKKSPSRQEESKALKPHSTEVLAATT
ncbi:MAG: cytochrome c biogenesis protein ResB [Planctomycetota bacterium]